MVQHNTIDHTGITGVSSLSYGSNANAVSSVPAGGASTLVSRADHVHLGVHSLSHTSNTFSGPVTLVAQGAVGITSPSAGTFAINAVAGSGGAAGSSGILQSATATRTAGNLTTSSTTFIDATSLTVTLTTGARRCLVMLQCAIQNNTAAATTRVDIAVDGTRQGQDYGLAFQSGSASDAGSGNIFFLTGVLTAASHTIKVQWSVDNGASTGTIFASTAVVPAILTVIETGLTV